MTVLQAQPLGYLERVNRAIDFVVQRLDQPLPLEDVAQVACFSPFHFHRVFQSVTGETLHAFVRRLRLERALHLMSHDRRRSLTQIALACGFASSSDFSRSFKQRYGVAPKRFDLAEFRDRHREQLQAASAPFGGIHRLDRLPVGENPDGFEVALRQLPARVVAYIRAGKAYSGYGVVEAIQRLVSWAEDRGLADGQWLGYMWDDPEIVPMANCRYDVGLEVPDVVPSREIGRIAFPPMLVAQVEIRGGIDLELRALDWLFRTWLPNSGYVPADQPCFEAWIGRPLAHGNEYFEIHAHLPVARA